MLGDMLRRLRTDEARAAESGRSTKVDVIATTLGFDRSTIYKWEDGSRPVPPDALAQLLRHYGATKEEEDEAARLLVFGSDQDPQPSAA